VSRFEGLRERFPGGIPLQRERVMAPWRLIPVEKRPDPVEAALAVAVAVTIGIAMLTLLTGLRLQTAIPLDEGWDVTVEYGELRDGRLGPAEWFGEVRESRPIVPRLVLFADLAAGSPMLIHLIVTPLALLAMGALLVVACLLLFRGRQGGATAAVLTAAAAVCFVFAPAGIEVLAVPFRMQFALGMAALLCAFALVTVRRAGPPTRRDILAAAGLVLFAQLCMAQGALGWLVLAAVLRERGAERTALLGVLGTGVAVTAAYYVGYTTPPEFESPLALFTRPLDALAIFLGVMGSPFEPFGGVPAAIAGGAAYLAFAGHVFVRNRDECRATRPGLFLATVAALVPLLALFTAAFRAGFDGEIVGASRYVIFAGPGWAALIALAWSARMRERPALDPVSFAGGLAAVALMAMTVAGLGAWNARLADMRSVVDALAPGVYDPAVVERIYPEGDPQTVAVGVEVLGRLGISIYAGEDNSELMGVALEDRFVIGTGLCVGFFDRVLNAETPTGAGVAGWAWDPGAEAAVTRVAIVDESGRIVGIATTPVTRPDVQAAIPDVKDPNAGWFGYSDLTSGPARAFALLGNDVACELTGARQITAAGD
jgi:hypothetical protein